MLRYWISLTNSKRRFCVDPCDYDRVRVHSWRLHADGKRIVGDVYGKRWYLARYILGITDSEVQVDHINRNIYDNRRCNLREGTGVQNRYNSIPHYGSSDYKGVCRFKRDNNWRAYIVKDGIQHHLGYFNSEIEAARAYDKAARKYFGEFAYLNFPDEKD